MDEREVLDRILDLALEEDVGPGDRTTEWTVPPHRRGSGVIVAKAPLVASGMEVARRAFHRVDAELEVETRVEEGERVEPEGVVLRVQGRLRGILTGERVALNFLGRLSGVATLTRAFVDAISGTGAAILDTRKTIPGWRGLEKAAVRAGGGQNHRLGLHDMVLVKDNHLVAAGGVSEAVRRIRAGNTLGLPVEVEVNTLEELDELLPLGVDRILLDNMDGPTMAEAVRRTRSLGEGRPLLEASGNVTLDTVRAVAETGVDLISVGALTHSAPQADLSLRVFSN